MTALTETLTVENVVASTGIGQELDLESLAIDMGGTDYDPDNFPGLIYRVDEPDVATALFGSGEVVITGGKGPAEAEKAIVQI